MNKFATILFAALLVLQGAMAVPGIAAEFDPHHNQTTADVHQQDEDSSSHQHEEGEPCKRVQTNCHQCHMHMFSNAGGMQMGSYVNASVLNPSYAANARGISHSLDTPPPKIA